ncbi:MAG: flagellar type III secretion system pore protein FliP [Chloroflexota bacterium]
MPDISIQVGAGEQPNNAFPAIQLMVMLTLLAISPALLITLTSFTRIVVVLALVRSAVGIPQIPPNQVLLGLSLFLSFFIMAPTWNKVNEDALQPYVKGDISQEEAIKRGEGPVRSFLLQHTREKDLGLFVSVAHIERPGTPSDVPTYCLIPAFVISELKTAFQMGFYIFVPFLIVDMVVASTLLSMGMMMLPPAVISLPFKLLLFTLVDGWHLVVKSLLLSFQ